MGVAWRTGSRRLMTLPGLAEQGITLRRLKLCYSTAAVNRDPCEIDAALSLRPVVSLVGSQNPHRSHEGNATRHAAVTGCSRYPGREAADFIRSMASPPTSPETNLSTGPRRNSPFHPSRCAQTNDNSSDVATAVIAIQVLALDATRFGRRR